MKAWGSDSRATEGEATLPHGCSQLPQGTDTPFANEETKARGDELTCPESATTKQSRDLTLSLLTYYFGSSLKRELTQDETEKKKKFLTVSKHERIPSPH